VALQRVAAQQRGDRWSQVDRPNHYAAEPRSNNSSRDSSHSRCYLQFFLLVETNTSVVPYDELYQVQKNRTSPQ